MSLFPYFETLVDFDEYLEGLRKIFKVEFPVILNSYRPLGGSKSDVFFYFSYLLSPTFSRLIELLELVDEKNRAVSVLREGSKLLQNSENYESFFNHLSKMISAVKKEGERVKTLLGVLSSEEVMRLNEAFYTLKEKCYFSAVVNSVVALESRLFLVLKSNNEDFLKTCKGYPRFTFGKLIEIYLNNREKFGKVIPPKNEKALQLCNEYRKISVHSKEEPISKNEAESVFRLVLTFLLNQ